MGYLGGGREFLPFMDLMPAGFFIWFMVFGWYNFGVMAFFSFRWALSMGSVGWWNYGMVIFESILMIGI